MRGGAIIPAEKHADAIVHRSGGDLVSLVTELGLADPSVCEILITGHGVGVWSGESLRLLGALVELSVEVDCKWCACFFVRLARDTDI